MSNKAVAEYLLTAGCKEMKGVVFLDELDRQMVLLRKGFKVVKLADAGLEWNERFSFYDQVRAYFFCIYLLFILFCCVRYTPLEWISNRRWMPALL